MHNKSVSIPNINCRHCVNTIESEVKELDNIVSVRAEEKTKMVYISWNDPQTWEHIKSLLTDINYPPAD
jgi:copper chaperone